MDTTKRHAPAGWLDSLAISEAELAAGKTVPAEPIFRRLQESIEQLEKAQAPTPPVVVGVFLETADIPNLDFVSEFRGRATAAAA